MEFSTGAWYILAGLISLAITIISFFVKKAVNKADEHDREISEILSPVVYSPGQQSWERILPSG